MLRSVSGMGEPMHLRPLGGIVDALEESAAGSAA
jgi:hypothetical protein